MGGGKGMGRSMVFFFGCCYGFAALAGDSGCETLKGLVTVGSALLVVSFHNFVLLLRRQTEYDGNIHFSNSPMRSLCVA